MKFFFMYMVVAIVFINSTPLRADALFTLGEYLDAENSNDTAKKQAFQCYIKGAADTHLVYELIFQEMFGKNLFCIKDSALNAEQLKTLLDAKIVTLFRADGEKFIKRMPLVKAVEIIVGEAYDCKTK